MMDFTFHDLRHTATTNMRRAGVHDSVDYGDYRSQNHGHVFKRYNTVGKDELKALVGEKI